jgi:hypothetical protein
VVLPPRLYTGYTRHAVVYRWITPNYLKEAVESLIFLRDYNKPELSKRRKRAIISMAKDVLVSNSQSLFRVLQQAFWIRPEWVERYSS